MRHAEDPDTLLDKLLRRIYFISNLLLSSYVTSYFTATIWYRCNEAVL